MSVYTTGTGQTLGTHSETAACSHFGCVVHAPSEHHMREWPTHWREDRGIMERLCPHGIGHPDPDALAWIGRTLGAERETSEAIHGCDGCCSSVEPA